MHLFRVTAIIALIGLAGIPASPSPVKPYDYAALWRSWPTPAQERYVQGFSDAITVAYLEASLAWLPSKERTASSNSKRVRRVRDRLFLQQSPERIPEVMTGLYQDPANAHVFLTDMVFVARDKMKGKDFHTSLRKARKKAMDDFTIHRELSRSTLAAR